MLRIFLVAVTGLLFSNPALAKDWQSMCKDVPDWPKGSDVPADGEYADLATPVDGAFAKAKWDLMKAFVKEKKGFAAKSLDQEAWVIIDARSKEDRSVGKVPKSALITADYKDASKNQFNDEYITKKVNKALKTKFASIKDMKNVNFIVFCNGRKCHRSSFGACELRRLGIERDNVYVMLGGFPDWKDKGYPVR